MRFGNKTFPFARVNSVSEFKWISQKQPIDSCTSKSKHVHKKALKN